MSIVEPILFLTTTDLSHLRTKFGERMALWSKEWAQIPLDWSLSAVDWQGESEMSNTLMLDKLLFQTLFVEDLVRPLHSVAEEVITKAREAFFTTVFRHPSMPVWQNRPSEDWLTSVQLRLQCAGLVLSLRLAPEWVVTLLGDQPSRKPPIRLTPMREALAPKRLILQVATQTVELTVADLVNLSVGDVIPLEKNNGQHFALLCANIPLASGVLCQQNTALAFNIQKWAK